MNGLNLIICALQLATPRLEPAQPGDRYTEYCYPIFAERYTTNQWLGTVVTNQVTNFCGGWTEVANRLVLHWSGRAGSNYVVETSVSLTTRPYPTTNEGWIGDGWRPCSMLITGLNGTMGWTSGVPHKAAFYRVRAWP
jgi:hypothetical protein